MENWKKIPDFETYEVSNEGRIRNKNYKVLKPNITRGHLSVMLKQKGKRKSAYIHRLVAEAFLENKKGLPVVNHIDYDPTNNRVENLEWCTQAHNVRHSSERMKKPKKIGDDMKYIRRVGKRYEVCVRGNGKSIRRSFETLHEAKISRDKIVREVWGTKASEAKPQIYH